MANALLDVLVPILRNIEALRYSELASSSIIVMDYLITIDQEVQHVWFSRWTSAKILFFLNRYYTLFVVVFNNFALFSPNLTDKFCLSWFKWQGWTGLIAAGLAETILQLRLYALYYGNKKVLALMVGCFISAMASSATIMGLVLHDIKATSSSTFIQGSTFCIPSNAKGYFYAFWIPILCFETLLCALACIRGYKSYKDHEIRMMLRHRNRIQSTEAQISQDPDTGLTILEILLRDSVGYFVIIFATYLTTTMVWIFGEVTLWEIPVGFTVALSSVIGNRLLLNLRDSQVRNASVHHSATHSVGGHTVSYLTHIMSGFEDERTREHAAYELRNMKVSN